MTRFQSIIALLALLAGAGIMADAQPTSFRDDFSMTALDPAWTTSGFLGSYSLSAHPGFLRYGLTSITHNHPDSDALWIYRPFSGTSWTLETRASFYLPYGNGRQFWFKVILGDMSQKTITEMVWFRAADQAGGDPPEGNNRAYFVEAGLSPGWVFGPNYANDTYVVQIQRNDQTVTVRTSPDGANWTTVLQHTFATPLGTVQNILLSGSNYNGTGYADYDYVSLTGVREVTCTGFEAPMDRGPVPVKQNRTLPLKATLTEGGRQLTNADIAAPVVEVTFDPGTGASPVVVDAIPAGSSAEGNRFTYGDGKWQFNLSTRPYGAPGAYSIVMKPGSADYSINPSCSAQFIKN